MGGFKVNDRVRRSFKHSLSGVGSEGKSVANETVDLPRSVGTVKAIKEETSSNSNEQRKEHEVMIQVAWDNGTVSYLGPDGLVLAA